MATMSVLSAVAAPRTRVSRTAASPSLPAVRPALLSRIAVAAAPHRPSAAPLAVAAPRLPARGAVRAAASSDSGALDALAEKALGPKLGPGAVTVFFIALWYALNVGFNLTNKSIFGYFPFPWTVSTVHVLIGSIYCGVMYAVGLKKASFGRRITKDEALMIAGPASMHAIGHVAANLSFAAVAISLTHTVKTLEPAFSVVLSQLVLGQSTPLPVVASLVPIMVGVAMASASELSFNWTGFVAAMVSNLTFGFRAVWSKRAMGELKNLDSTAIYAWTTLISLAICLPGALLFEGPRLAAGAEAAIAQVGARSFYGALVAVGLLYHLYNQFAFNTLSRVNPVSHGVCNVVKRIVIIFSSVAFFGNVVSPRTQAGTAVALAGTALYTFLSDRAKQQAAKAKAA